MNKNSLKIFSLILISSLLLIGCSNSKKTAEDFINTTKIKQLQAPEKGENIAVFKTNKGDIKVKLLDQDIVGKTIENFITHAESGYYNGVSFHRVIEDFMIQSGDPEGTGMGGESIWGEGFEDEFHMNYRNYRGALSMANAGPDTNGSQFFIVQAKEVPEELLKSMKEIGGSGGFSKEVVEAYETLGGTPNLDGKHTVFGQVYQGMDIVDEIASIKTDDQDKPLDDIIIETINIEVYSD